VDTVFWEFRSRFIGKVSPVHFLLGQYSIWPDALSGRCAPERPGADPITKEAYSHEVISMGFWPGDGEIVKTRLLRLCRAGAGGFKEHRVRPAKAFYCTEKANSF